MPDYLYDLLGVRDRLVMDPVHGGITLYAHEIAVIDHPLFQRLRHICQNDILNLVFPGATHSRFLHSIGTLHVGGRMLQSLVEHALRRWRQGGGTLSPSHLEALTGLQQRMRLACLLHDCGHSSFSHQFSRAASIRALLDTPGRFHLLWAERDWQDYYASPPERLEHEHYSVRLALEMLEQPGWPVLQAMKADVLSLMDTTACRPSACFRDYARELWPILTGSHLAVPQDAAERLLQTLKGLVSGEVDADRADYMLRDSFHSSVTLGSFNLDHLLKNLHIGYDKDEDWLGLAVTGKGLGALEDFVYSRYQMYRKVYAHKTSIGFDWLLRTAIDEVLCEPTTHAFIDSCLSTLERFQTLTDHYFWEAFRRHAEAHPHSAAADLVYRRKLRHLASAQNLSPQALADWRRTVAAEQGCPPESLVAASLTARFSRIRPGYQAMRLQRGERFIDLCEASDFFTKFTDLHLHYLYRRDTHPAA